MATSFPSVLTAAPQQVLDEGQLMDRKMGEALASLNHVLSESFNSLSSEIVKAPRAAHLLSYPALALTSGVFSYAATTFRKTGAMVAHGTKPLAVETSLVDGTVKVGNYLFEVRGARSEQELEKIGKGMAIHWPWALKIAANGDKIPPIQFTIRDRTPSDVGNASTAFSPKGIEIILYRKNELLAHMAGYVGHEFGHVVDLILLQLIKDKLPPGSWVNHQGRDFRIGDLHFSKRASDNYYSLYPGERNGKYDYNQKGILSNAFGKYWFQHIAAPAFLNETERQEFRQAILFKSADPLKRFYSQIFNRKVSMRYPLSQSLRPGYEKVLIVGKYDDGSSFEHTDLLRTPNEAFVSLLISYLGNEMTSEQKAHYKNILDFFDRLRFSEGDAEKVWQACQALPQILDEDIVG